MKNWFYFLVLCLVLFSSFLTDAEADNCGNGESPRTCDCCQQQKCPSLLRDYVYSNGSIHIRQEFCSSCDPVISCHVGCATHFPGSCQICTHQNCPMCVAHWNCGCSTCPHSGCEGCSECDPCECSTCVTCGGCTALFQCSEEFCGCVMCGCVYCSVMIEDGTYCGSCNGMLCEAGIHQCICRCTCD